MMVRRNRDMSGMGPAVEIDTGKEGKTARGREVVKLHAPANATKSLN